MSGEIQGWTFTIKHPKLGVSVKVKPGQSFEAAIAHYNGTILGEDPPIPITFTYDAKPVEILSKHQITVIRAGQTGYVKDPATDSDIPVEVYVEKYIGKF